MHKNWIALHELNILLTYEFHQLKSLAEERLITVAQQNIYFAVIYYSLEEFDGLAMNETADVAAVYNVTSTITVGTKINLVYEYAGEDEENVDCYFNLMDGMNYTVLQFRLYYGNGLIRFWFDQQVSSRSNQLFQYW